jgi:KUP system potassium uptake protein
MVITTMLLYVVARERWGWSAATAGSMAAAFLVVDLAFFGANIIKVAQGGWLPLALAGAVFVAMTTWKAGRRVLAERIRQEAKPLEEFLHEIQQQSIARVAGTAIFMNGTASRTPAALRHNIEHNKVLHEQVIFVTVHTQQVPHVRPDERVEVKSLGSGLFGVNVYFGFMEEPNIPEALAVASVHGLGQLKTDDTTYFLGRETIIATAHRRGMAVWREKLFALMSRNATTATAYFGIPPNRVVELGEQVEI